MIPRECKRLAEVDFPIAEVSRHAAREKSIRHGHPSTLHLWWARRPLASSRAVLMALLLPDPCDLHCPEAFRQEARRILLGMHGRPKGWTAAVESDEGLRRTILKFVADFANWDRAADRTYVEASRALVKAAHGEDAPLVVDPFAGGGSIPLEALRLGCEAFASDLNPVACLILKVMLEDIPRHGTALADELRKVGGEIKRQAERELADLYPADPDGATPIAYLWARTMRCEAPRCGGGNTVDALVLAVQEAYAQTGTATPCRSPRRRRSVGEVRGVPAGDRSRGARGHRNASEGDVSVLRRGVATRTGAGTACRRTGRRRCHLRRGWGQPHRRSALMTAVVTLRPGETGRHYRLPAETDYAAVHRAQAWVAQILEDWEHGGRQGLCPVPDEPISLNEIRRISVPIYGMKTWGDLFTARQKAALVELARLLCSELEQSHSPAVALLLGRMSDFLAASARWKADAECPVQALARQALPFVWDFAEACPWSDATGSVVSQASRMADAVESACSPFNPPWPGRRPTNVHAGGTPAHPGHPFPAYSHNRNVGQVQPADATGHPLPDQAANIWFTDPPYYDAVPYAHLADFFFVWLKRALPGHPLLNSSFEADNSATPKTREIVVDRPHRLSTSSKDAAFYESGMAKAFAEGRRVLSEDGIGSVVFAHKTTEGWEALLAGMIRGGWTITGSWPIATEMGSRLNARETAALATSVHLICRPRPDDAPIGDWADVLRELPRRVADWMERLQGEGIRGADLVFACVGPALEIFSRYRAVETAEGREVGLPEYLEKVWEVVGRTALENVLGTADAKARNGAMGALEEDARLTALFLWTLQSTEAAGENGKANTEDEETVVRAAARGFNLPFDVVRRFAQPMGIDLDRWTGRIIGQEKGVVRLLPVSERAPDLFGKEGARAAAGWIESNPHGGIQQTLFPEFDAAPKPVHPLRRKAILDGDAELQALDATALDRVHAAMVLQASGHANALRALIAAEQDRGPDFLRLANALSALYPRGSHEKRLLDAMLLAVPR